MRLRVSRVARRARARWITRLNQLRTLRLQDTLASGLRTSLSFVCRSFAGLHSFCFALFREQTKLVELVLAFAQALDMVFSDLARLLFERSRLHSLRFMFRTFRALCARAQRSFWHSGAHALFQTNSWSEQTHALSERVSLVCCASYQTNSE